MKLWDLSGYSERTTPNVYIQVNLQGFVWSHRSITGLISQTQFAKFWRVDVMGVVLSEHLDKSHNFTNSIFMKSSL